MSTQNTRMIDVSSKKETQRLATARARININKDTLTMVRKNKIPKISFLTNESFLLNL